MVSLLIHSLRKVDLVSKIKEKMSGVHQNRSRGVKHHKPVSQEEAKEVGGYHNCGIRSGIVEALETSSISSEAVVADLDSRYWMRAKNSTIKLHQVRDDG